jgi:hypothetical protein
MPAKGPLPLRQAYLAICFLNVAWLGSEPWHGLKNKPFKRTFLGWIRITAFGVFPVDGDGFLCGFRDGGFLAAALLCDFQGFCGRGQSFSRLCGG